jgi:DNA-binding transcriptional MerR regulator
MAKQPLQAVGDVNPVTQEPVAESELTIEQLAQETGMSVRNIRAHQSRGLLPPPELRARTGYYGAAHVTRLRLIQEMQAAGFNLAAIKHLVEDAGEPAGDQVIDFARALMTPFESERPEMIDGAELAERLGGELTDKLVARAEKLGLVIPVGGGRYEVPSPTLLAAGESAVRFGIPLPIALDAIEQVVRQAEGMSRVFVRLFLEGLWKPFDREGQPETDWPRVREALEGLRPLASDVVVSVFQQRMSKAVEEAFGKELGRSRSRK